MAPKDDQDPGVKPEGQSDSSSKLPKTGFFQGDRMAKFVEEAGLFTEPPASKPKPEPVKAAEKKPCPNCPPEDSKAKPEAQPEAPTKPWKTLKVGGKEVPVKDEKHLEELAQQGVDYTKKRQADAEWEKDLAERERKLLELTPFLEKIAKGLDAQGKAATPANIEAERQRLADKGEAPEEAEEPIDPAARDQIKALKAELSSLKAQVVPTMERAAASEQAAVQEKIKTTMDSELEKARTEFPFDDVLDEESGKKITDGVFQGIFVQTVLADDAKSKADPSFKMKTMHDYMTDTAKQIYRLQQAYKGDGNGKSKLTADSVQAEHPEIYEEISQAAVADYLRKQKETPGSPRARSEAAQDRSSSKSGKFKGLDDAFEKGFNDPVVESDIEKVGRQHRA